MDYDVMSETEVFKVLNWGCGQVPHSNEVI